MNITDFFHANSEFLYQMAAFLGSLFAFFIFIRKWFSKSSMYEYIKMMYNVPLMVIDIKNNQKLMFCEFKLQGKIVSSILDTLELAQFLCDSEGKCIKVNPKWVSLTGLTEEDARGHHWLISIHPDDRDQVQDKWLQMIEHNAPFEEVFRYQNRVTKQITRVKCTATDVLDDDGGRIFILGLSRVL